MRSLQRLSEIIHCTVLLLPIFLFMNGCETQPTEQPFTVTNRAGTWVDLEKGSHSTIHISSSTLLPTTSIEFTLPTPAIVTLTVIDGRDIEVARLLDRVAMDDGTQMVEFNASELSSGVYVYTLIAEELSPNGDPTGYGFIDSRKMMLIK